MRVLVTRPRDQGEATARRLAAVGHEALVAPVLEVVPTGAPPPAGVVDGLIVTSANAVPALAAIRDQVGALPAFAVGRRTAELLEEAGFARVLSADGDAAGLATLVARTVAPGGTLLHVAGRDRRPEPAVSLRAAGYDVVIWETYAARPAETLPEALAEELRTGMLQGVLHYSRRTASLLIGLIEEAGLTGAFAAVPHVCLSGEVAAALEPIRPLVVEIASRPDEDSLFASLDRAALRGQPGPGSRLPQSG